MVSRNVTPAGSSASTAGTQRYVPTVRADEDALTRAIIALAVRVWPLWLSPGHGAAAGSRLAGGQGSGSAHLASRGAEGPAKASAARPAVAE